MIIDDQSSLSQKSLVGSIFLFHVLDFRAFEHVVVFDDMTSVLR